MEMYKQASKLGLRLQTSRGPLSVDQLWQLNLTELSNAVKAVKKILKKSDDDELSFLENDRTVDVENQLRFDILKDIYLTKKKESDDQRDAVAVKAHNQKILALIEQKRESKLNDMSEEELLALLKE